MIGTILVILLTAELPASWGLFIAVAGFGLGWYFKFFEFSKNNKLEEKKIDSENLGKQLQEKNDFIEGVQAKLNQYEQTLKECDEHLKRTETQLAILMKQHRLLISALKVVLEKQEGEDWVGYIEALLKEVQEE